METIGLVLVVFYLSDRTYDFLQRFFLFIMFGNIILVVLITVLGPISGAPARTKRVAARIPSASRGGSIARYRRWAWSASPSSPDTWTPMP